MRKRMERARKNKINPALHWMLLHMVFTPLGIQIMPLQ